MTTAETLYRLHGLLPLKERQQGLSPSEVKLHRTLLRSFVERGRPLAKGEISRPQGTTAPDSLLDRLRACDLVVLDDRGEVAGAYPFTTEKTPHRLRVSGHRIHAMCALDALAVSPMFGLEVQIDSRCAISGEPIYIRQRGLELLETVPSSEILLGIHWREAGNCAADSLCQEMVFLKNLAAAISWQGLVQDARELFSLQEAMELAAAFFVPLISEG